MIVQRMISLIFIGVFVVSSPAHPEQSSRNYVMAALMQQQEKSIEDIATDSNLWGKDFPSVLQSLPAFSRAQEPQVSVFPFRIVGRSRRADRQQMGTPIAALSEAMRATQQLTPDSPRIKDYTAGGRIPLKIEVFQDPEDRSFRVSAAADPSVQFLRPGLTILQVRSLLGKEEKISTEVLDDGTERRPVILTLHHYAGGAIIFAESDVNPQIGSVDRVILDTAALSVALFKEGK